MYPELIRRLEHYAKQRPDGLAMAFPRLNGNTTQLTWRSLYERAKAIAAGFQEAGVHRADIVLIVTPSVEEQVLGFLAALFAGAKPSIFSFPSIKQSSEAFWHSFSHVIAESGAAWVACSDGFEKDIENTGCKTLRFAEGTKELIEPGEWSEPFFLQFSSGTTGLRKGVAITQTMFVAQMTSLTAALRLREDEVVVSWLPLYHDMGLVGAFLFPLHMGLTTVHFSPFDWLAQPIMLFKNITDFGGTITFLPNFSYHFLARRIDKREMEGISLRTVRAFISAGEPVRPDAHREFESRFGEALDCRTVFQALYGMAEATFAATATELNTTPTIHRIRRDSFLSEHLAIPAEEAEEAFEFFSCGRPIPGMELRIGGSSEEAIVGEIELRGSSLFDQYYGRPGSALSADGWFKTGDLGFVYEGELYVTGRKKDLIIHYGANLYPADIEEALSTMPGVKSGRAVVFGVEADGTELVVAMAEKDGEQSPLTAADVRAFVSSQFGFGLKHAVIVAPDTLLKSTSGKLSRKRNRELYLAKYEPRSSAHPAIDANGMYALSKAVNFKVDGAICLLVLPSGEKLEITTSLQKQLQAFSTSPRLGSMWMDMARDLGVVNELLTLLDAGVIIQLGTGEFLNNYAVTLVDAKSSDLIFNFRGGAFDVIAGVAPQDFLTETGLSEHNLIMLRDPNKNFYLSGVSPDITSFGELMCWCLGCRDSLKHTRRVHTLGNSLGGYAALRAAYHLRANTAWAFAPVNPKEGPALAEFLATPNGVTEYHVWYGTGNEDDTATALGLKDFEGVILHPVDTKWHWVVKALWAQNKKPRLLVRSSEEAREEIDQVISVGSMVEILSDSLNDVEIGPDTSLNGLLDSFTTVEILGRIQERLGWSFSPSAISHSDLQNARSLSQAISALWANRKGEGRREVNRAEVRSISA